MRRFSLAVAIVLLAVPGCADPTNADANAEGVLLASVAGTANVNSPRTADANYQGTGWFYVHRNESGGPRFSIHSRGVGTSAGSTFVLVGALDGIPAPGIYPLVPQSRDGDPVDAFIGGYSWILDGDEIRATSPGTLVGEAFTVHGGWVEIISASEHRIEGRFELTAHRFCQTFSYDRGGSGPCHPLESVDNGATIQSVGEFSLVPNTNEVYELPG